MDTKEKTTSNRKAGALEETLAPADARLSLMRELDRLTSSQIMNRIMRDDQAQAMVPQLPSEDFFWLIKKLGDQDCLPILRLASEEQWQYVLDLELWQRDRLDLDQASEWIKRLQEADPARMVHWLFQKGEALAYYYLFQKVEVVITYSKEEVTDLPEGFFSSDGIFHIRAVDPEEREVVENLVRTIASEDQQRYQALILGLLGVLPAELEEQMLRMRNVRLGEHGFLPFEEAISVYAPLSPDALQTDSASTGAVISTDEETLVPLAPLDHTGTQSMLTEVISGISDPVFLDRLRLEFAGLCNQILSADKLIIENLDVLVHACRRAAGYLNLALERLCGEDVVHAHDMVRDNTLLSLFRVGFGLALKLRWQAERWVKKSWFALQGFDFPFWGEDWGGTLLGILQKRPKFYAGSREEEEYRDFERLSELGEGLDTLRRLMVLDGLLGRITEAHNLGEDLAELPEDITFRTLLFNFWARQTLGLEPGFQPIPLAQARELLVKLQNRKNKPPYPMKESGKRFVKDIMGYASEADPETVSILRDTLSLIWKQFQEEFAWISPENLIARDTGFFSVTPSPEAPRP